MADQLACGVVRGREAQPIDHVVHATLEHLEQHLTGDTARLRRLGEEVPELPLHDPVDAPGLLLLTQLLAVVRLLDAPPLAMLAGRVVAPLDRAFVGEASRAFEKELGPLPPAEPATCIVINRHELPPRPGAAWAAGSRCAESASRL